MTSSEWGMVVAIGGLILAAAFLAMAETSLTRTNRVKAISLAEEDRRGSQALLRLVEHPEEFLTPVLLLVLLCHLTAATLVGIVAERNFGALGVAVATVFEVVVIFVTAEAVPKTFAVQHPDRTSLLVAPLVSMVVRFPPIRLISRALIGLSNVIVPGKGLKEGPFVSEEELLAMADVAVEEDVIEREERQLIHSIIEFGDTVVREVMIPRPDMVAVEARASTSDVMEVVMSAGRSRIPAYEQGIDDIAGIVYAKDLMRAMRDGKGDEPVRSLVRPARFVPETKRVAELLPEMQREKAHMAIVVDEYGGTAGLVTLEDLIEELVGEIVDEYDVEESPVEPLPNGDVRVNARMPIDELNELLQVEFPEGDYDTVGGLVYNLLGHVPTEGETVDYDGHSLRAEKVQGRRIGRVRITKPAPPSAEG
ncbi:MAG TPA: hemolysin family protein [Acidimicrobiales bacterium]|jgi:CBS domain containing-hemolysin-like protein|nr:hemolysin family protein [Acidimicrobiales bacterium]